MIRLNSASRQSLSTPPSLSNTKFSTRQTATATTTTTTITTQTRHLRHPPRSLPFYTITVDLAARTPTKTRVCYGCASRSQCHSRGSRYVQAPNCAILIFGANPDLPISCRWTWSLDDSLANTATTAPGAACSASRNACRLPRRHAHRIPSRYAQLWLSAADQLRQP